MKSLYDFLVNEGKLESNITVKDLINTLFEFRKINCTLDKLNKTNLSKILNNNDILDYYGYQADIYSGNNVDTDKLIKFLQSVGDKDGRVTCTFGSSYGDEDENENPNKRCVNFLSFNLWKNNNDRISFMFKCPNLHGALKFFKDKLNIEIEPL